MIVPFARAPVMSSLWLWWLPACSSHPTEIHIPFAYRCTSWAVHARLIIFSGIFYPPYVIIFCRSPSILQAISPHGQETDAGYEKNDEVYEESCSLGKVSPREAFRADVVLSGFEGQDAQS